MAVQIRDDMTGKLVFGHSGLSGFTPCIFLDRGHFEGTRTDEVDYRKVKEVILLEELTMDDEDQINKPEEPYGYRTQGGFEGLYEITEAEAERLIALNKAKAAEKKAAEDAEKSKAKAEIDEKFDLARQTGEKVLLNRWMSDCHERGIDCSFDINYEYAMPDGTTSVEWYHCY